MDEAENFCNRIGILINGKFVCLGSPQELKNKYGEGYRITVQSSNHQEVNNHMRQNYPALKELESKESSVLAFQVPFKEFSFAKTFDFLYNHLQVQLKLIDDFQITQSSLEQIFIYFSSFQDVVNQETLKNSEPTYFCCLICGGG